MKRDSVENKSYIKELIIMALVIALVVLTISYGVVHATLDIAGIKASNVGSWIIKFSSAEVVKRVGTAEIAKEPEIKSTSISYEVNLLNQGDSVTIKAVVTNYGNLNAKLSSYDLIGIPSQYEKNISYKVTDENGDPLNKNYLLKGNSINADDKSMTVFITITYDNTIYEGEGTKTFNLGLVLNFEQDCANCA